MKFKILLFLLLVATGTLWGQTVWTYDFGTGIGNHTSSTASTSFLPTPSTGGGTARVRVGTNPGSITLANPGLTNLGTGSELQITTNSSSTSTTKFSIYDFTASKEGYLKFKIAFNVGTVGTYQLSIGDGASFSDNNNMAMSQVFAGIQWIFSSSSNITYNVLNGSSTYGTTGLPANSSTTLFSKGTSNVYEIEIYYNNTTSPISYSRSGSNSLENAKWDLWVNGSKIATLSKGGLGTNANIDSFAFNHQLSVSNIDRGVLYLDDFEYSNGLPTASAPTTPTITTDPVSTVSLGTSICEGTSGTATYTVSGANLTANIELTPTANIEISKDNSTWFNASSNPKLSFTPASGAVSNQTVYVRSLTSLPAGALSGQKITHTSTGATTHEVAVTGTVINPLTPSVAIAITSGTNPSCGVTSRTFTATSSNTGVGTINYQWKLNGANVGTNSNTYTLATPANSDAITCEITVIGGCVVSPTATSNTLTITNYTVPATPTLASNNSPQCANPGVTLTRNTPPAGETWYWQTTANGTSEADSNATYNATTAGTYYLRAKNTSTGCWSDALSIPVTISTAATVNAPTNQSVTPGNAATFTLTTTGTISSIQWQVDKGSGLVNVTGADGTASNGGTIFTTPPTTLAMNGYEYRAVVLGTCLSKITGSAKLTVAELPCLQQLSFTETPTDWSATAVTYASGEANLPQNTGSLTTAVLSNPNFLRFDLRRTTNSSAKTLYVEVSTTSQTGPFTIVKTLDHTNTTSGGTTTVEVDLSVYSSSSTVYIRFRKDSSTTSPWYLKNVTVTCGASTPEPELSLTQGATTIAHSTGSYDFGNQLVDESTLATTFTITNTGDADLTLGTIALSGANASDFSVTQVASATLEETETTTFTVTFTPSSLGTKTATVTIPNNDNTNYTFTVTGVGSYSSDSDIVANTGFTYTNNINYANYQVATITNTSHSVGVFQFAVRDGGNSADMDALPTTLNAISFNYTGTANTIRSAALFSGNALITSGVVTANGISFSGLSIEAPDNGSSGNITLRVTFNQTVTDNEKLVFTVASATADAAGSVFGSSNASGAASDNSNANDRNRIEVTADRLAFVQQPSNANINVAMTPAVTVSANDSFGNRDLDFTGLVEITSDGTLTGDPVSVSASNGLATFSSLVHTVTGTGLKLQATSGVWSAESNTFNISVIVIPNDTYRTTSNGTWPSGTATWEKFNGTTWSSSSAPGANTTNLLIIRHTITSNGAFAAADNAGTKMIVASGGTFNNGHNSTFSSLVVEEGGVFSVNDPSVKILPDTGILRVENGGKLIFNSGTLDSADGIFAGIEEFQQESNLEIRNWHFNNTSGPKNLINSNALHYVTQNSSGYHFGNIIINASSMSGTLEVIQNTLAGTNVMLCNNFTVLSNPNNIFLVNSATNTTIGGSLIVNTGTGNKFSFSANTSANATHTVKGNIELISGSIDLNQNSANTTANSIINLEGNLITIGGVLMNSDNGDVNTVLNFTGNVLQTVSIDPASNNTNIPFIVTNGAYVKIVDHNLKLGTSSKVTVKSGGTLDFGFNGTTALNLTGYGTTGTGFTSEQGSYLKITSPDGIVSTSGSVGNIQTNTAPSVSPLGTFHYIGKQNQVTGNAIGTTPNGRAVIVEMESDNLVLTPSTSFGFTNGTNATINNNEGGILDIRKGRFIETETNYVTGSTGHLKMAPNTYYEIVKASDSNSDVIPRMSGNYDITGGEIHLKSSGDQTLRGGKMYNDLTFSGGSIKTVSNSATPNIAGTVTIKDDTTLNVGNSTFGGASTNLVMQDTSRFINGGSATKPNIAGTYTLAPTSTIEFTGSAATQIRVAPSYANIIISGTNVTAGSTETAGLTIQNGTNFTIKDGATFKVPNPQGMYGNTQTAIKNSPAITFVLENNSTVDYNSTGADQLITKLDVSYGNLAISGANSIKKLPSLAEGNILVRKDLTINTAAALDIETNKTLLVGEKLNNSGDVVVRNNANFIQQHAGLDQNTNSGNFKVERVTRPMNRYSYTYWGAPVSTTINNTGIKWFVESVANSGNFNTQVASNQMTSIFKFNTSTQTWDNAIGSTTIAADGFIAKAPNNFSSNVNNRKNVLAEFQGAPFNGNITKTIVPNTGGNDPYTNAKMTFMSNPYPSAISIDKFLLEYGEGLIGSTPVVVPTIYLWTHASLPTNGVYSSSDFATYTLLGGTATEPDNDGDSPVSLTPEGKIASGQGFFVRGTAAGGTVTLKNDYRYSNADTGYNNQQFFRVATEENLFERHRFWLNLKGEGSKFKQTLIGYSDIASDGVDGLDGSYYEGGNPTNLYTILDDHPFVIQAYALPFDINDEIPLGFKVGVNGSYTIGLDNFDGLFESQTIYLKDSYQDVVHNLKDSDYQFTTQPGTFNDRFKVIFKPYSCDETTIWNGTAWSNGAPTLSKKVIIQGDLTIIDNTEACEVIVQSGVVTLSSDVTLTVRGTIDNLLAANNFVVANEANLIQIEDVQNNGAIKVYRNSEPIKHLDYTIWSSPVAGQVLQGFSPQTLPHRIYTYNNGWQNTGISPSSDTFKPAKAYMFRAPNNFVTTPYIYNGLFTGTPNNGTIELALTGQNFIGLGNPYPSNLKIDGTGGLRTQNPGIGSLYFWTNTNPYDNALQSYTGNNWSVYSLIGGISASNDDFDHVSNGYIPVGQGFIAEAPSVERLVFNNQMRTSNQGVFFRIAQDDLHRYWLDFRKEEQVLNKILVGYTPESTPEFDFGMDAKLYGYNGSALYTLISENSDVYAIQGRALPFDQDDVVTLGYKAEQAGTYSISLVNLDGLFEDTDIFIKDKMLDIEHNIKSGAYEFVTESGEFSDRLEIVYRTNLNVQNPSIDNNWIAYSKDNQIQLESVGFDMKDVHVYDMLGRVVYSATSVNTNKHQIHNLGANQVLIIKIVTPQGTTSVKKFQK